MEELINEIVKHCKIIADLQNKLLNRYGVRMYSIEVSAVWRWLPYIRMQMDHGFYDVAEMHGDEVNHRGKHHDFLYGGDKSVEVCAVHNGKRIPRAYRRNNKYTRKEA